MAAFKGQHFFEVDVGGNERRSVISSVVKKPELELLWSPGGI